MRSESNACRERRLATREIRRGLNAINPSNIANLQRQSPLWSKLPAEIRNEIFRLAVSQHPDHTRPYEENSYHYRPGYTHAPRVCIDLLLTCRLAYWETSPIPLRSATITVWHGRGPRPPYAWPFAALTAKNAEGLTHVHLFTQLFWLENTESLSGYTRLPTFRPKKLTITIRHSDWWFWESDSPLRIRDGWVAAFRPPPSLTELVMEFETLTRKKNQLDGILQDVVNWRFMGPDDRVFVNKPELVKRWNWTGRADLDGVKWQPHYTPANPTNTIEYYVVNLTWHPLAESADPQRGDAERQSCPPLKA
ncbi:uncharacterized protein K452DRAFT_282416 [Aplosporella prunicola CBS 121167]|uniref:Uncharacterized protein n=1 Tax=Aplosporella prunicola CBS 121167 TaxID=1176127 RepID=A0A6A6BWY5_9PEZI|nr:uncharacterized protein K452DRAFT_282416 [Aplosporella prunicola CBS 121167]KAF2147417.1 hypothetical protein K452DRAFT_282416 [Aplosporella prunicola CBS 121167]